MKADHFSADVRELLAVLQDHGVRYLLVGGQAVIYYGYVRFTGDIGIFYEASPGNARRLFAALVEFWGLDILARDGITAERLTEIGKIWIFGRPPNRVDLISDIAGIDFATAWGGRLTEEIADEEGTIQVPVIGLAELIANKRAAARSKDLVDVEYLERITRDRDE